ncbi:aldehyde dehydrogenase (NAD+) [Halopolyspora algeriensis]|uniref:Salicylaldehyde dehydrogenase n=1 Tax=Halopolyspora algeriensis TaxID=1500506 RepID=A0A368VHI0_9ACTN|nr:aldehyde dehydrogenase family protein [Halopolyspora algeriensis]RCW38461.1 aldehyde dehydrogenase (NAD+) [Halopolyspora algeriensis]TQM42658.1 aldehyde dehydrogenase (NAD+) [Halopolyspora algeriensis]
MSTGDQRPAAYTGFNRMPLGGEWRSGSSGSVSTDVNPYTDETLTEIPLADASDVDRAYQAAKQAQSSWAATLPGERSEMFRRAISVMDARRQEIVDWLVRETGGVRERAEFEWGLVRAGMAEVASYPSRVAGSILPGTVPGKENRVYRQPVGVVGVISPWNFPFQLSHRSVAPALALGNAVVLKPAGDTPVTGGLLLARVYEEAGLPPGLLNVVIGKGSEVGQALVTHDAPQVISFTGSTPVGEGIAQQAALKRCALELGGNGPLVVLDDADIERAVDAAVFGSYYHQGQICMATNRVIVDDSIHDDFVERFTARVRALRFGDPDDSATQIGPIINDSQRDSIQDKISRAVSDGARLVVSGDPVGPAGRVLPPHLLLGTNEVATAAEEVFGPVSTVIRAKGEQEALQLANDTEYGLASAVHTADVERGVRFAQHVQAGMTHVNDTTVNDEPNTAFGGEKASGIGRFGGEWAIEEFTTDHWISVQHQPRDLPLQPG